MELRINPFNPRPCYVEGWRALCHGMDARSGYAMVEREDGSVEMVRAERVRFTDSPSFFDGYRWEKR